MSAEKRLLEFVRQLAKATVYESWETGKVIDVRWKEEAQEILEEEGL